MSPAKFIVCGGRYFNDRDQILAVLAPLLAEPGCVVVTGGAPGADALADSVARALGATTRVYVANWGSEGPSAGPRRNQRMLDTEREGLTAVLAFHGGAGTADMVRRARKACVPVRVIPARGKRATP